MKKIQKIIVAILSIFLLFNSTSSVVKGYAEENVATQSANVESIVACLKELHPEFSENEIRTAVNQAINGQVITLPSDPSERGSAFIETALFVADPGSFIANSIDSVDFYPNNGRINLWK